MDDANEERKFNDALCARVKRLREAQVRFGDKMTAQQMAEQLRIPADRYRKYEDRSPLPAYLMERFCVICRVDLEFLLTGKHRKPARAHNKSSLKLSA